jgi:hypothetical protein
VEFVESESFIHIRVVVMTEVDDGGGGETTGFCQDIVYGFDVVFVFVPEGSNGHKENLVKETG